MHLSSEIEVILSLKKAYSSEGVPTLNMASKIEFLKPLHLILQSYKVQEAEIANLSQTACSYKTAHPSKTAYSNMVIQ